MNPTTNLLNEAKRIRAMIDKLGNGSVYGLEQALNDTLRALVSIDFTDLSKADLIEFFILCLETRAVEPSFLLDRLCELTMKGERDG